jgi:hypothetical protein
MSFLSTPSVEQRDDSLREEIMNADDDDDHHAEDDHDAIPSNGFFGMKLTPKSAYRAVTTPMTAAVTPMTPSPIQSPSSDHDHYLLESVSPDPGTAPTTAPGPPNSYLVNHALSDLQQGYVVNSTLLPPEVQVKCRALFRDAMTPDSSRPLHDVVQSSMVPSTIQKSCRRGSRLSQSLLIDAPMMPAATPFGISERRRSSNTRDRVSPTNTSPDNSLHCSPDTSPRTHQRFNSKTFSRSRSPSCILNHADTEKRNTIRPRRNLLVWMLGLVALSSAATVLMMSWSLVESSPEHSMYHHPVRPDLRYSDAGLRGKMVQAAGQNKDPKKKTKAAETSSHSTTTTTTTKAKNHKREAPKQHTKAAPVAPYVVVDMTASRTLHVVHIPPKISIPKRKFDNQDPSMYARGGNSKSKAKFSRRVVSFDKSFGQTLPHHRSIRQYPADFTDNTQLYSILSSSDERLSKMELREPYSNGECVPMQDWQTTFYPVCNGIHEIGMESTLGEPNGDDVHLFGTKGYWRNAWRLDLLGGNSKVEDRDTVVLKTLK